MTSLRSPLCAVAMMAASAVFFSTSLALAAAKPNVEVAVNSLGAKMDPADMPLATELRVYGSVFDTLIKRDYAAEAKTPGSGVILAPSLATAWRRLDGRTVELDLRKGVRFHNGDEMTADDVAFTFSPERVFADNAILPGAKNFFGCFEPVKVLDPYKVQIRSCSDDATLELKLAHYSAGIVNKRSYLAIGQAAFKRAPIGTGPLKFVQWQDGNFIKFAAFDDYFGGRPAFRDITFREVPEAAARVAGLVSGDYDLITQVSPDQISQIEADRDLKVLPSLLDQMQILWVVGNNPAIADKRVRQAMAKSIDRLTIVKALWSGYTEVADQFQLPALGSLYDPSRTGFSYTPEEARSLLKEAHYEGQPVTIRVLANYYVNGEAVAQAIQAMWQKVGLNAKLEIVNNWSQAFAPGAAAVMGGCGFEYAAPEALGSCFFGERALTRQRGFPDGIAGVDALAKQLTTTDVDARRRIFQRIVTILQEEVPAIPLYRTPQFFAAKRTIVWKPSSDFRTDFRPESFALTGASQ